MKVEQINPTKKEFKPITLQITVETPQELCDLWHRMNVGTTELSQYSYLTDNLIHDVLPSNPEGLWRVLDTLVIENNLKK